MAIRRCPYCRAIIDEGLEYCSNCGTQLLFPEDEFIEEDIPGEKIIDMDEDMKAAPKKRGAKPRGRKAKAVKDQKDEEEAEPGDDEEEKIETASAAEEEEAGTEDEERLAKEETGEEEKFFAEEEPEEEYLSDREEDFVEEEPLEEEQKHFEGKEAEPVSAREAGKETADASELGEGWTVDEVEAETEEPPQQPKKAFTTGDLEKIVDPAEREKVEIERFLESIRRDRGMKEEAEPQDEKGEEVKEKSEMPSPPQPERLTPAEEAPEKHTPATEEMPETPPTVKVKHEPTPAAAGKIPETGELPPWASKIREEVYPDFPLTDEAEKPREEEVPVIEEISEEEQLQTPETRMGIPETADQQGLPFAEEPAPERKTIRAQPTSGVSSWLRSRIFDFLFIAVLWAVAIFIASRLMEVPLLKLVSNTPLTVAAFYLVLIVTYFFLFLFFLGETLGDRLFAHEE